MLLHQFWCTRYSFSDEPGGDCGVHWFKPKRSTIITYSIGASWAGCSTVSVCILMKTMVVFGSWSQTLLIWRSSFYNSHQYLNLHLCFLALIWEKRATCTDCIIGVPFQCNEFLSWLLNFFAVSVILNDSLNWCGKSRGVTKRCPSPPIVQFF